MELTERVIREREAEEKLYEELHENPVDLDSVFQAFVNAIHHNYVGFEQKRGYYTPAEYHTYVYSRYRFNSLTMEMLVRSLHQLTGDMHDRHLTFHCDDWIDYKNLAMKYRVRPFEDCLYVTEAEEETGLVPGDRILEVQHMTPERVRRYTRHNCFYSRDPERELWGGYLRMAQTLKVQHADGTVETMKMKLYPEEPVEYPIEFRMLDDDTAYLKLEQMDAEAIHALLEEHGSEIEGSKKLILDMRRCVGGEEGAGWELFPYLVDHPVSLSEMIADEGSYVYCTKTNCEIRYHLLEQFKETLDDPQEMEVVEQEMKFYREHYGKGFVYRPAEMISDETITPAEHAPEKIVILTDTYCENEGEQFVAMCQRCGSKVVTVGRPTMGTLDYFDCIHLAINEHMTLSYPIRMTKAAYEGRGISERGLPVDTYVAWTPDEIQKDLLLVQAKEL
jgi:hypothetical protein